MATDVNYEGSTYTVPAIGERTWAGTNRVDGLLIALAQNVLQKAGGNFTLSGDVDWGATAGHKATYYKSRTATPATAGIFRVGNNEVALAARNAANSGNLTAYFDSSDIFQVNTTAKFTAPSATGIAARFFRTTYDEYAAYFSAGLGLTIRNVTDSRDELRFAGDGTILMGAYSTGLCHFDSSGLISSSLLVNADVHASAAIAYSKLSLTGSIVNADINASAAIAYSKLALTGSIVNADVSGSAAIAYSKLALTGSIVNADVNASAAIARSKLASGTASHVLINDGTGVMSSEAALAVTRGGTNLSSYTTGDLLYASGASTLSKLAIGASNFFLRVSSGAPAWVAPSTLTNVAKSSNYTLTSAEEVVYVSGTTTLTLPSAASNPGKTYYIIKTDSYSTTATIAGTIDGGTNTTLNTQYERLVITNDNSNWYIVSRTYPTTWTAFTPTLNSSTSVATNSAWYRRVGDSIEVRGFVAFNGAGAAGTMTATIASSLAIDTNKMSNAGTNRNSFGYWEWYDDAGSAACRNGSMEYNSTAATAVMQFRRSDDSNTLSSSSLANNDVIQYFYTVPISGWAG